MARLLLRERGGEKAIGFNRISPETLLVCCCYASIWRSLFINERVRSVAKTLRARICVIKLRAGWSDLAGRWASGTSPAPRFPWSQPAELRAASCPGLRAVPRQLHHPSLQSRSAQCGRVSPAPVPREEWRRGENIFQQQQVLLVTVAPTSSAPRHLSSHFRAQSTSL